MQPREKILAIILAAAVAAWVLGPAVRTTVFEPLDSRDREISALESDVDRLDDEEFVLFSARRRVQRWREMSLPPDPLDAQRVYHQWLNDVALFSGWEDVEIRLGTPSQRGDASYTAVPVTIEAQATLDDINRFMQFVESTRLLQRMTRLDIDSPYPDGNPPMHVIVSLEGVALHDAPEQSRLFPMTRLQSAVAQTDDLIQVTDVDAFPADVPFRVRIDQELIQINEAERGEWRVTRGIEGSLSVEHESNAIVELTPRIEDDKQSNSKPGLLVERLFVKTLTDSRSTPYFPALEAPPAIRGEPWTAQLLLDNWNARRPVRFEIDGDVPSGLMLDASSGRLEWTPSVDAELGFYEPSVSATTSDGEELIAAGVVEIELRRPNSPPELSLPESVVVWLGREFVLKPTVSDPDLPDESFLFEFEGDLPEGASFDADNGELTWTPSVSSDLGEVAIQITVFDDGRPRESDSQRVVLNLKDDRALYTYLVGGIIQGDDKQALFRDRSADDAAARIILREGDELQVADIQLTVETVRIDSIDVLSKGQRFRLANGENLRQLRLIDEDPVDANIDVDDDSAESITP